METAGEFYERRLEENYSIGSIQLMQEFADRQLSEKENRYEGVYNGLKFRYDEQVEQVTLLNDTLEEVNKEVCKWKELNENRFKLWKDQLEEITQLKQSLQSKEEENEKVEIDFNGNVKVLIEVKNNKPKIIKAMDGRGDGIRLDDIKITNQNRG